MTRKNKKTTQPPTVSPILGSKMLSLNNNATEKCYFDTSFAIHFPPFEAREIEKLLAIYSEDTAAREPHTPSCPWLKWKETYQPDPQHERGTSE